MTCFLHSAHEGPVKFSSLMLALIALSSGKLDEKYRGKKKKAATNHDDIIIGCKKKKRPASHILYVDAIK